MPTLTAKHSLTQANKLLRDGNILDAIEAYDDLARKTQHSSLLESIQHNIRIAEGRLARSTLYPRDQRIIVYSCNFGSYETIKEPKFIDDSVQYILFTDNKKLKSKTWDIRVIHTLGLDSRRASRLPKILPHKYLPEHEVSVYIDSSLELLARDVRLMVAQSLANEDIALYRHYKRNCVYDEIDHVLKSTDRTLSDPALVTQTLDDYATIKYPRGNGLFENAFVFRRNTAAIRRLNDIWWNAFDAGAERDQFTLMYALHKAHVWPRTIKRGRQFRTNPFVHFYKHQYKVSNPAPPRPEAPKPRLFAFIPYAPPGYAMNLGRVYNEYMERLGDEDFALFLDHDAMITTPNWRRNLQEIAAILSTKAAVSFGRTNRINNPYQRLGMLENDHELRNHVAMGALIEDTFRGSHTECSELPSASGVVFMLSKKTWEKHKFRDGFLKVDNNLHISLRNSGDPVYLLNELYAYHFYRADNDESHAIRVPASKIADTTNVSAQHHKIRNFIIEHATPQIINDSFGLLGEEEYGCFVSDRAIFCNKDWYLRLCRIVEAHPDVGLFVLNSNSYDREAPIGTDVLKHRKFADTLNQERCISWLPETAWGAKEAPSAFVIKKKAWSKIKTQLSTDAGVPDIKRAFTKEKIECQFVPCVYLLSAKNAFPADAVKYQLRKQLRIAVLTYGYWPQQAGMEMMVHNLATNLTQRGHQVVLFAPKPKAAFSELKARYIIRRFIDEDDFYRLFRIHHRSMPFDVIYVQGAYEPCSAALQAATEDKLPVVLRTHGEDIQVDESSGYGYRLDPKKNEIILHNIRSVSANVVIGSHILKDVKALTGGSVELIYNGVDVSHFTPGKNATLRATLRIDADIRVLLTVGRNVRKKTFHLALDVLQGLLNRNQQVVLIHAGKPGNGVNLREYAEKLGIGHAFFEIGEISYFDMPDVYRCADIFIFPSKTETFGNVTVEAMASGLPCVEFDYVVNREKIAEGETGHIIPHGDVDSMVDALVNLLCKPEMMQRYSDAARRRAVQKFSWEVAVKAYEALLTQSTGREV